MFIFLFSVAASSTFATKTYANVYIAQNPLAYTSNFVFGFNCGIFNCDGGNENINGYIQEYSTGGTYSNGQQYFPGDMRVVTKWALQPGSSCFSPNSDGKHNYPYSIGGASVNLWDSYAKKPIGSGAPWESYPVCYLPWQSIGWNHRAVGLTIGRYYQAEMQIQDLAGHETDYFSPRMQFLVKSLTAQPQLWGPIIKVDPCHIIPGSTTCTFDVQTFIQENYDGSFSVYGHYRLDPYAGGYCGNEIDFSIQLRDAYTGSINAGISHYYMPCTRSWSTTQAMGYRYGPTNLTLGRNYEAQAIIQIHQKGIRNLSSAVDSPQMTLK